VCDHVDLTIRRLEGATDAIDRDVYRSVPRARPDRWVTAWKRTADLLADMKAELAPRGIPLVVVIFTFDGQIEACVSGASPAFGDMDMSLPTRRMMDICARLGIACLDLAPRFAKHPPEVRRRFHLAGDGHWSSTGHIEAASETAKFMLDETDLWKRALERSAR